MGRGTLYGKDLEGIQLFGCKQTNKNACYICPDFPLFPRGFLQDYLHPFLLGPDEAVLYYICARGHRPVHIYILVGALVSGSSEGSGLVDSVVVPMGLQ